MKNRRTCLPCGNKGTKRRMDKNVLLKKQSALDWLKKINELKSEDRDDCEWSYVLLGENTFIV